MTPEAFTYWLQGFFELRGGNDPLTREQVTMIRSHLDTVFNKVTVDALPAVSDMYHTPKPFPSYGTVISDLAASPGIAPDTFKKLC